VPTKGILDIAKGAVPEHMRNSGRLVTQSTPAGSVVMALRGGRRVKASPAMEIASRVAKKLGVKARAYSSPQSGDVEFTEKTRVGKRSIVVQVRGGKVKQIIKRAGR
jgi:hypothetical protein